MSTTTDYNGTIGHHCQWPRNRTTGITIILMQIYANVYTVFTKHDINVIMYIPKYFVVDVQIFACLRFWISICQVLVMLVCTMNIHGANNTIVATYLYNAYQYYRANLIPLAIDCCTNNNVCQRSSSSYTSGLHRLN